MGQPVPVHGTSSSSATMIVAAIRTIGAVAVILLFIGAAVLIVYVCVWWLRNRLAPVVQIPASVARKRERSTQDYAVDDSWLTTGSWMGILERVASRYDIPWLDRLVWPTDFYVTFSTPSAELEFRVSGELYISVTEGDQGILVYKGETFQRFITKVLWQSPA